MPFETRGVQNFVGLKLHPVEMTSLFLETNFSNGTEQGGNDISVSIAVLNKTDMESPESEGECKNKLMKAHRSIYKF